MGSGKWEVEGLEVGKSEVWKLRGCQSIAGRRDIWQRADFPLQRI